MEQVREWVESSPRSNTEIAQRAGISRSTLHRIIHGTVDPRLSTLTDIAVACGRQLELTGQPLSDPEAAYAARILLDDTLTNPHQPATTAWIDRYTRLFNNPTDLIQAAATDSTLTHRPGATAYRADSFQYMRALSETDSVSTQWAVSGAPLFDGIGPTIVWTDNPTATCRLLAEHMHPTDTTSPTARIIVAPAHPSVFLGTERVEAIPYVHYFQALIDSLPLPGPLAERARRDLNEWD